MSRYDVEEFSSELETLLRDNLNRKIVEVNERKVGAVVLKTIDPNAFFFQTLDKNISNYDPCVFFNISGGSLVSDGPSALVTYQSDIYILFGNLNDENIEKVLMRYHSALIELVTQEWREFTKRSCKLVSIDPAGFAQINSTEVVRATGITIEVTIGI